MPDIISQIKSVFRQNCSHQFLSAIISISATVLIYISYFQRNFISKTYAVYSLIFFLSIFILSLFFIAFLKKQMIANINKQFIISSLSASVGIGLMLLLNLSPVPFYLFVPDGIVEVHFQAQDQINSQSSVTFLYLRNTLGFIPQSEFELTGSWQRDQDHLMLASNTDAGLVWKGKTEGFLEVGFLSTQDPYEVRIFINGERYPFNLQGNTQDELVVFNLDKDFSILSKIPFIVTFLIVIPFFLLMGIAFLASIRFQNKKKSTGHPLLNLYGFPILITSVITLLTFWPGMMTNDSITQWREIVNRSYTDLNPLFHTLLYSLLVQIWQSPAAIALFQILVFFFVITFGMGILSKWGIPRPILWITAFIIALWPFNPMMTVILWKDFLYGISLLGFFIILLEVILSDGFCLEKSNRWIILSFSGFLVASFRHNGSPVAFLTLVSLPFIYHRFRKQLIMAIASALLIWICFQGPIKTRLIEEKDNINPLNLTMLHHIAAHLEAGTLMTEEQVNYLDNILPLEDWDYDCCYMGNIYTNPAFDKSGFMQFIEINRDIAYSLFLRNPGIDIQDQLCASEMTWRFLNNQCTFKSLHPFESSSPKIEGWIPRNDMGLSEASVLPGVIPFFAMVLERIQVFSGSLTPLFRPAFYFYFSILAVVVACLRLRNIKALILLIPIILQTGSLALVNFAPAFRYQYGICLIGLFCLGVLWLQNKRA